MSQHWFGRLPTVLRILLPTYLLAFCGCVIATMLRGSPDGSVAAVFGLCAMALGVVLASNWRGSASALALLAGVFYASARGHQLLRARFSGRPFLWTPRRVRLLGVAATVIGGIIAVAGLTGLGGK